jgi:selenocysteine lyase/cysteine desulfurase
MVDDVYIAEYMPTATLPDREEAGTPNIVGAITLGAVLNLLTRVGMDKVREKEIGLIDYAWQEMSKIDGVTLYGPDPAEIPRTGTLTFNIKGFDHGLTAAALNDYHNIQVRNGCFCAHPRSGRAQRRSRRRAQARYGARQPRALHHPGRSRGSCRRYQGPGRAAR